MIEIAIVIGGLLGFVAFWALVCFLISFGGWKRLAQEYRFDNPPSGQKFSGESLSLGSFTSYNNCLTIHVGPEGIHLAPWVIFRPGHPPLLLPSSAIHFTGKHHWFFGHRYTYQVGEAKQTKVIFFEKVHQAIQNMAASQP